MKIKFTFEIHQTVERDVKDLNFYDIPNHNLVDISGWTQGEVEEAMHRCDVDVEVKDFNFTGAAIFVPAVRERQIKKEKLIAYKAYEEKLRSEAYANSND